jgi:hypothetical protein
MQPFEATKPMVAWECPTNPREASGLDPEAVHKTGWLTLYALVTEIVGSSGGAYVGSGESPSQQ